MTEFNEKAFDGILNRFIATFKSADSNGILNGFDKDLAIPFLTGMGILENHRQYLVDRRIVDDDLDPRSYGEGDELLLASKPGGPLLTVASAANFRHRKSVHANRGDRRFNRFKAVGPDIANDFLHDFSARSSSIIS